MLFGLNAKPQRRGGPRQVGDRVIFPPQGRLTLASGTPVMATTQAGKTTIYWTPSFGGQAIPVWNGARFEMIDVGGEISNVTTATTAGYAGPAAVTTNSNYDLFGWGINGKGILSRGPLWASSTSRGTGAGTTELELLNGILVNKYNISNGPPARRGTFLGTVRSNGSSQIDWIYGAIASGATAGSFGVWNMYNRVNVSTMVGDTADSWTYGSSTYQQVNANANMKVSFLAGLAEDDVSAVYSCLVQASASGYALVGLGYDSTSARSGFSGRVGANLQLMTFASYSEVATLGWHSIAALELSGAGTATFYGDGGETGAQYGMTFNFRA